MSDRLLPLGVVARPHGIQGELRVKLHNPTSTLLCDQTTVFVRHHGGEREARIVRCRLDRGAAVVRIVGCDTRNDAESLRGAEICVPREALPELGEGEYYHIDLVGAEVQVGGGEVKGRVVRVAEYPTVDCLVVDASGNEVEVPFTDACVLTFDAARGVVVVDADAFDSAVSSSERPNRVRRGGPSTKL